VSLTDEGNNAAVSSALPPRFPARPSSRRAFSDARVRDPDSQNQRRGYVEQGRKGRARQGRSGKELVRAHVSLCDVVRYREPLCLSSFFYQAHSRNVRCFCETGNHGRSLVHSFDGNAKAGQRMMMNWEEGECENAAGADSGVVGLCTLCLSSFFYQAHSRNVRCFCETGNHGRSLVHSFGLCCRREPWLCRTGKKGPCKARQVWKRAGESTCQPLRCSQAVAPSPTLASEILTRKTNDAIVHHLKALEFDL
jgi:hypothetical protein